MPSGGEGGIDSGLRPSPFGRRVRVVQNRLRRFCRPPLFHISGSNPRFVAATTEGSKPTGVDVPRGGEGGIRTLDGLLTHTPLAGARLRPLGHLSGQDIALIAERGMIPARSSPGKAKGPIASIRLSQTSSTILATGAPERDSWSSSRLMRS